MAMIARCDHKPCGKDEVITDGAFNTPPDGWVELHIRHTGSTADVHAQLCGLDCAIAWAQKEKARLATEADEQRKKREGAPAGRPDVH